VLVQPPEELCQQELVRIYLERIHPILIIYASHWQMRDITNDALRKLYLACKRRSGFPGNMPATVDSNENDISVHAILQGLGLIKASSEDFFSRDSKDPVQNTEHPVHEAQHRGQCLPLTSASVSSRSRSSSSYTDTSSLTSPHHVNTALPDTNRLSFANHSHAPCSFEGVESSFVYEWGLQLMTDPLAPWPHPLPTEPTFCDASLHQ